MTFHTFRDRLKHDYLNGVARLRPLFNAARHELMVRLQQPTTRGDFYRLIIISSVVVIVLCAVVLVWRVYRNW
jgi:hypothetical protein